ncbi:hypothetical protein PR048_015506 [Dryococelus australis]|uniref:Uncharacterized protein n=1 Tax=Dryococelus australis TaxID=614101 RepID=A0ABQ9HH53_9NEOP|nr:hypothetical protein PR048_015506 [Dryococelus australis]
MFWMSHGLDVSINPTLLEAEPYVRTVISRTERGIFGLVVRLLASHQGKPRSPDFRTWKSCRTTSLVGGFSRRYHVSLALAFRRRSIPHSAHIHSQDPIEVSTEQHRNARAGELRENSPTSGIVRNDSLIREYRGDPTGNRAQFDSVGGKLSDRYTTSTPCGPRWLSGWPARLPPRRTGFPRLGHSGFSHVGIVPDDAASRRVFSRIYHFSRPFILALLHTHLASPLSALKTSITDGGPELNWCGMSVSEAFRQRQPLSEGTVGG